MTKLLLKALALCCMSLVAFGPSDEASAEAPATLTYCVLVSSGECDPPEEGCTQLTYWCYDDDPSTECNDPDPPPPPPPDYCTTCAGSCDLEPVDGPCEGTVYYQEVCEEW